jgi:ABC-type polysaccharide/polyol phosphate export permease
MNILIWGSGLIKRIYIPRTIFAISVVGNGLVNFLLAMIPLTIIMLAMHQPIRLTVLFLPIAILLMCMFILGWSLLISTLAVFFVDTIDMYSVLLSAWFYLTPIIYPISIVPPKLTLYINLNPMTTMLEMFRAILYWGELPSLSTIISATIIAIATLIIGWWVFTKKVDEFAYLI